MNNQTTSTNNENENHNKLQYFTINNSQVQDDSYIILTKAEQKINQNNDLFFNNQSQQNEHYNNLLTNNKIDDDARDGAINRRQLLQYQSTKKTAGDEDCIRQEQLIYCNNEKKQNQDSINIIIKQNSFQRHCSLNNIDANKKCIQYKTNSNRLRCQTESALIKSIDLDKDLQDYERKENEKQINYKNQDNNSGLKQVWIKNFFGIFCIVYRFIYNLKEKLIFIRPDLIKEHQVNIINDKVYNFRLRGSQNEDKISFNKNRTPCQKKVDLFIIKIKKEFRQFIIFQQTLKGGFIQLVRFLDQYFPVMDQTSPLVILWNIVNLINLIIMLIIVPFDTVFHGGQQVGYIAIINIIILSINILFAINTSYYCKGNLITKRKLLIQNYVKNKFVSDIVAYFCVLFVEDQSTTILSVNLIKFCILIKLGELMNIIEKLREYTQVDDKYSGAINLGFLLMQSLYLCHIFSCLWYEIGKYEKSKDNQNWLDKNQLSDENQFSIYVNSFYYSVVTLITIGYGDITPQSDSEKIFVIVAAFMACNNFAYSINQIGNILNEFNKQKQDYRQKLAEVNKYMRERDVPKILQGKVRKYLEYIYSEGKQLALPDNCLSELSRNLREKILQSVNLKCLKSLPYSKNFSNLFLEKLSLKLKEFSYYSDEIILQQGNLDPPILYCITKGEVEIYLESHMQNHTIDEQQKSIKYLKKGQHFGDYEFFTQIYDTHFSFRSKGICQIQQLKLSDFLEILKDFPQDREVYCLIRDNILIQKKYEQLDFNCLSCGSKQHQLLQCSQLFYCPSKLKILNQYNKLVIQDNRGQFQRKTLRTPNALTTFDTINEVAYEKYFSSEMYINILNELEKDFIVNQEENIDQNKDQQQQQQIVETKEINCDQNNPQIKDSQLSVGSISSQLNSSSQNSMDNQQEQKKPSQLEVIVDEYQQKKLINKRQSINYSRANSKKQSTNSIKRRESIAILLQMQQQQQETQSNPSLKSNTYSQEIILLNKILQCVSPKEDSSRKSVITINQGLDNQQQQFILNSKQFESEKFILIDLDCMYLFSKYMPQFNYNQIIQQQLNQIGHKSQFTKKIQQLRQQTQNEVKKSKSFKNVLKQIIFSNRQNNQKQQQSLKSE